MEVQTCQECIHIKVCPMIGSIIKLVVSKITFWNKIKLPEGDNYPVVTGASEFAAKYCAHYKKEE